MGDDSESDEILEPEPIVMLPSKSKNTNFNQINKKMNAQFKRELDEREQKNSLQLLLKRQQMEAERKRIEEQRKSRQSEEEQVLFLYFVYIFD